MSSNLWSKLREEIILWIFSDDIVMYVFGKNSNVLDVAPYWMGMSWARSQETYYQSQLSVYLQTLFSLNSLFQVTMKFHTDALKARMACSTERTRGSACRRKNLGNLNDISLAKVTWEWLETEEKESFQRMNSMYQIQGGNVWEFSH